MKPSLLLLALSFLPAATAAAPQATTPPALIDGASWITADDYPPQAIRNGDEGLVVIVLLIDATGKLTDCRIDASSGAEILDRTTCDLMRQRARFDPARDGKGRKVAATLTKRVNWRLPVGDDRLPLGPVVLEDALVIEAGGFPLACTAADRVLPARAAMCQPASKDNAMLLDVIRWAKTKFGLPGAVQLRMTRFIDHGGTSATTLRPLRPGEFLLREVRHDFDVDAQGTASGCRLAIVAQEPGLPAMGAPSTSCDMEQQYSPLVDATGVPTATKAMTIERASIRAAPAGCRDTGATGASCD